MIWFRRPLGLAGVVAVREKLGVPVTLDSGMVEEGARLLAGIFSLDREGAAAGERAAAGEGVVAGAVDSARRGRLGTDKGVVESPVTSEVVGVLFFGGRPLRFLPESAGFELACGWLRFTGVADGVAG